MHRLIIEMSDFIRQTTLINRSNLFKQNHGVSFEAVFDLIYFHMSRQFCFLDLSRNRSDNDGRAKAIADIVLNDENRTNSTLL